MSGHLASCRWIQTSRDECEYVETHNYCPHSEHACDCLPMSADTPAPEISPAIRPDMEAIGAAYAASNIGAMEVVSGEENNPLIKLLQSLPSVLDYVADLESRLSAATRDSERLDWLEANAGQWSLGYVALRGKWRCEGVGGSLLDQRFLTAREAIDAARSEPESKP